MFLSFLFTPWILLAVPFLYYLLPFFRNWSIQDVPGPFLAKFSNLWFMYQCRTGHRFYTVYQLHEKHGKLVRVQPDHVSVADPDAIPIIYGHGTGFLKSYAQFALLSCMVQRVELTGITESTTMPSSLFKEAFSTPEIEPNIRGSARRYRIHFQLRASDNSSSTYTATSICSYSNGTKEAKRRTEATTNSTH